MPQYSDPGIPTLTQRVEPSVAPAAPSSRPGPGGDEPDAHDPFPVLTDKAEPTLAASPPAGDDSSLPPWEDEDLPVLTDIATASHEPDARQEPALSPNPGPSDTHAGWRATPDATPGIAPDAAGGVGLPQAAFSTAAAGGDVNMSVLRAALQAEFEQTLQQALDDATALLRTRLETELPAMIERAMNKVRPG